MKKILFSVILSFGFFLVSSTVANADAEINEFVAHGSEWVELFNFENSADYLKDYYNVENIAFLY